MRADSTELLGLAAEDSESLAPDPSIPLRQKILRAIATARWRDMMTIAIIVVDFYFLYSSFSLIGVFFPAEVRPSQKSDHNR